ncbi:MAG: hypothetical protein Fur006_50300 [Coleofasciculaceae cyanobacterium]
MKGFPKIIAATIISASILGTTVVNSEEAGTVFEGGGYRVVVDEISDAGLTYEGCDSRGRCINLSGGQRWSRSGKQGITWINKQFRYNLSWPQRTPNQVLLEVYQGNKRIMQRNLVQTSGE